MVSATTLFAENQRIVKVGAFNYYPGIFKDADGEIKGFYVEVLNQIGQNEHIQFEYVFGTWNKGLERIKSGDLDLLTSVAYSEDRAKYMDYSSFPLLTVWGDIYVTTDSHINGILDLER